MRLLITGGSGFIGSNLARLAVHRGHRVLNIDKLTYAGNPASLCDLESEPRYCFLHADICDALAVCAAFADFRPDAVMHLAAESHVDRSIDGPMEFVQTNVVGAVTLLQAATEYWRGLSKEPGQPDTQTSTPAFRFSSIAALVGDPNTTDNPPSEGQSNGIWIMNPGGRGSSTETTGSPASERSDLSHFLQS